MSDLDRDVKGETTDASASLSATPACAVRRAPQSLPPSPHMSTEGALGCAFCSARHTRALPWGDMREKTRQF